MKQITRIQDNKTPEVQTTQADRRRSQTKHNWHLDADGVEVAKGQGEGVPDSPETPAAPAQAQHSPLTKQTVKPLVDAYDELRAHAQRLADAAKQVECDWNITRRKYLPSSMAKLREALAEWSKSV